MENDKMMLIYGFSYEEKEMLNKICSYKVITEEMTSMNIGDIIRGLKFQIYNKEVPKERVILFNSFSDAEINSTIKSLKLLNFDVIMAVVTPTSMEWKFDYLVEHLIEERDWHRKNL